MSFKFYSFCQNGIITGLSSVYAAFVMSHFFFGLSLWLSTVLAVLFSLLWCLPVISIFYPFIIGIYMVLGIIGAYPDKPIHMFALIALLLFHALRMISMFIFAISNPEKSAEYDYYIRYGYKP